MNTPTFSISSLVHKMPRRHMLAHIAFILVVIQVVLLTRLWWLPAIAQTSIGKKLFPLERLALQHPTPLAIQVQEITQHPSKPAYWNIKIKVHNHTGVWVSYPNLVLTFLDETKNPVLRNVWSPKEYTPSQAAAGLEPGGTQNLSLWLKLPDHLPSEYNLDYFYPY